jgi:hypothetical protein
MSLFVSANELSVVSCGYTDHMILSTSKYGVGMDGWKPLRVDLGIYCVVGGQSCCVRVEKCMLAYSLGKAFLGLAKSMSSSFSSFTHPRVAFAGIVGLSSLSIVCHNGAVKWTTAVRRRERLECGDL